MKFSLCYHSAIKGLKGQSKKIHVEEKLLRFITSLVAGTRTNKNIYLGASPSASIGILKGSKALAAMRGRDFVTPDDIIFIAPAVLRHRIVITPEKEMEGSSCRHNYRTIDSVGRNSEIGNYNE